MGAYANRLTAVDPNWTMAESDAPQPARKDLNEQQYWRDFINPWMSQYGVKLVGGCCGITPEHISYMSSRLKEEN
jgi:methionine synthase I (cobalamin-dependent)